MKKFIYSVAEMVETTRYFWYGVGIFSIISLIIAHYGLMGFNWKWFIFFELPLYCFICWVFYAMYRMRNIHGKNDKKQK